MRITYLTVAVTWIFVAACTITGHGEIITPTLTIRGHFKATIGSPTTPSGTPARVASAFMEELGRVGELYDTNGDGEPDLARDTATGKFYEIRGIRSDGRWNGNVNIHYQPPVGSVAVNWGATAEQLHRAFGFDRMSEGDHTMNNVAVHSLMLATNPLESHLDLSVRWSSRWADGNVQDHPGLAYEIDYLPSTVTGEPWFLNHRVSGRFIDVARYLVRERGCCALDFASIAGPARFDVDPTGGTIQLWLGQNLIATAQL